MPRREFLRLVRQAYRELPKPVREALGNVDVELAEWPAGEDLRALEGEGTLLGLYHGVPLVAREGGVPALPDRIVLYRQPILQRCATRADVVQEIRTTLRHEVGHCLGMSEEELHRLGYG